MRLRCFRFPKAMRTTYEQPEAELIALHIEKSILSGESGSSESVHEEGDDILG